MQTAGRQMTIEFICVEISMLFHSEKFYGWWWVITKIKIDSARASFLKGGSKGQGGACNSRDFWSSQGHVISIEAKPVLASKCDFFVHHPPPNSLRLIYCQALGPGPGLPLWHY